MQQLDCCEMLGHQHDAFVQFQFLFDHLAEHADTEIIVMP